MNLYALEYLCDPVDQSSLSLCDAELDSNGQVVSGRLVSESGREYSIIRGIPRFVRDPKIAATVTSFGDEWNFFNFVEFKEHWLQHTVLNTFGGVDAFRGKVIVDAGGGGAVLKPCGCSSAGLNMCSCLIFLAVLMM